MILQIVKKITIIINILQVLSKVYITCKSQNVLTMLGTHFISPNPIINNYITHPETKLNYLLDLNFL